MDGIVARAEIDAAYRAAVLDDLESALREAGQEPPSLGTRLVSASVI
jgi:hypothetical protein